MSFEYGEPGAWLWLFTASIATDKRRSRLLLP
jgi:hypothetical protein